MIAASGFHRFSPDEPRISSPCPQDQERSTSAMKVILILCSIAQLLLEASAHSQHVFRQADIPDETLISSVLSSIEDPADALISLFPNLAIELSEPRFLEVLSVEGSSNGWYTEADKLRLRRNGTGFIDWTGRRLDSEPVPPSEGPWPSVADPRSPPNRTPKTSPSSSSPSIHRADVRIPRQVYWILQPALYE